jgi:hypothetical protein
LNDLAVAISSRRSRIPNLADPWFESYGLPEIFLRLR